MLKLLQISLSVLIFTLICMPAIILSVPVVAYLLHTSWDGRTTIFGNAKWGRANNHPSHPTKGFWQEFIWLVYRNPVNNLFSFNLAVPQRRYQLFGDAGIGDKLKAGFYRIKMGLFWEYYWIFPYQVMHFRRCIRVRIGWKIYGNSGFAAYVFAINPVKPYLGG